MTDPDPDRILSFTNPGEGLQGNIPFARRGDGGVAEPGAADEKRAGRAGGSAKVVEISAPPTAGRRLLSLDVLRGLTIAFMIMVNNNNSGPGTWTQMDHAFWNGFTAT